MLDAVKAHAGSREWVHGFLFRWGLDKDRLIELARDLDLSPQQFVKLGDDGVPAIGDWRAVYEAVIDRATVAFDQHMNDPRAAAARNLDDLLTVLCGKPTDAGQAWIADMRN